MIIVGYGGGTDSTAMLIGLWQRHIPVDLILFSDPGGEQPHTYWYLRVMDHWLRTHGMPPITRVWYRDFLGRRQTLEQECLRSRSLPSIAYGHKKCSQKYKIAPQDRFCNHYPPCREVWERGERVVKIYSVYSKDLPLRIPLSAQKEFKRVRNMVIRETLRMSQELVQSETDEIAGEIEPDVTAADDPSDVKSEEAPPLFSKERRYWTAKKYLRGSDTTPPDYGRAVHLLLMEADDGNAQAMCDLGRVYREGLLPGSGPDPEKAREWYAKALAAFREKEHTAPNSQTEYRIARLYAGGLGVEADDAEAERWIRLAAEKENPFAQNALASLLLKQGKPEEAARWLERAAKQGNPAAQYALGRLHLLGTGVPQDRELAMELLGRSAAQGDTRAAALAKEPERVSLLPAAMAVTRMLHHMSRIFEHNCKQDQVFQELQIDRKRWRELQELRIAMGHMADDHEDPRMNF